MITNHINEFLLLCDKLNATAPIKYTNIFQNRLQLQELAKTRKWHVRNYPGCILLFVSRDINLLNNLYTCYFAAHSLESLSSSLNLLTSEIPKANLAVSVIGKEPDCNDAANVFLNYGFILRKQLVRSRVFPMPPEILKARALFEKEYVNNFEFASERDVPEVLRILNENFDPIGDNLPDTEEAIKEARFNHIPIIRLDGKIAALHYFTLHNNIYHGLYDVTVAQYRGGLGLTPALGAFTEKILDAHTPPVRLRFGWRDITQKRLIKHSREYKQIFDNVVIYNMLKAL